MISPHPTSVGTASSSMVFFRPTVSTRFPTTGLPKTAPRAIELPMNERSDSVTRNGYSPAMRRSPAGDVQPRMVPIMNPPIVAAEEEREMKLVRWVDNYFLCPYQLIRTWKVK
jgi:hypothetical protein